MFKTSTYYIDFHSQNLTSIFLAFILLYFIKQVVWSMSYCIPFVFTSSLLFALCCTNFMAFHLRVQCECFQSQNRFILVFFPKKIHILRWYINYNNVFHVEVVLLINVKMPWKYFLSSFYPDLSESRWQWQLDRNRLLEEANGNMQ